jgi:hypothetical protein
MTKGIIYLIQPAELVGTDRYKIGCSSKTDLDRCKNGYKNGSRYLCIAECNNPFLLENKIKTVFNNNFTLIAGNEYYKGNENDIFELFVGSIIKHKNNDDDDEIEEEKDNEYEEEEENEIDYSNKIYKITTIDDFLKSSDIGEIIITNIKTKTGYLKFNKKINKKSNKWYEIFRNNKNENLLGWLKHYSTPHGYINNIVHDFEYDYNKIIKDICNNCYKVIQPYKLQYHEYFVSTLENNELESIIINTKDLTVTYHNSDTNILTNYDTDHCHNLTSFININTNIIDIILNELIMDKNILKQYKKLCHNVFIEPKEEIVFYDYAYGDNFLSIWLIDALSHLYSNNHYVHYYDQNNKDIKKYKPRIVCINFNEKHFSKIINDLQIIGIKNIIVRSSDHNMYNYKSYIKYITDNIKYDKLDYDFIFYKNDLLFYNFLKWCCI